MIPIEQYRLWWTNRNTQPLLAIYNEGTKFDSAAFRKAWMDPRLYPGSALAQAMEFTVESGDFRYLDDAMVFVDEHLKTLKFAGEAFPHVELNLGPGVVAAFITGFAKYGDGTVWFEPPDHLSLGEIIDLDPEIESPYARIAIEGVERISRYFEGRAIVTQTDLGGVIDILASLRSSGQVLMDFHDCPEKLAMAAKSVEAIWRRYFDRIADIIMARNGGLYSSWMYLLSDSTFFPSQCDLSAMISPDAFEEVVLPSLQREADHVGTMVYHLDGTGEIPHVNHLLTIDGLHAIQWVSEPGQKRELDEAWYPLYRRIIDAGKKVVIYYLPPDPDAVKKLFAAFPKESFYLEFYVTEESEAEDLLRLRDTP